MARQGAKTFILRTEILIDGVCIKTLKINGQKNWEKAIRSSFIFLCLHQVRATVRMPFTAHTLSKNLTDRGFLRDSALKMKTPKPKSRGNVKSNITILISEKSKK